MTYQTRKLALSLLLGAAALSVGGCVTDGSGRFNWPSGKKDPSATPQATSPVAASVPTQQSQQVATKVAASVRSDAPTRYVVRRGDTLWDISKRFLRDPFYWPEIWNINRQIENPHLIYPGDVLLLEWVNGQPRIRLENDLGPRVRISDNAIPIINPELLAPFLRGPRLVEPGELEAAPYLLQTVNEHLLASANDEVYVRRLDNTPTRFWQLLRRNREYLDPETGELLGIEAIYIGEGLLQQHGDPGIILLTSTTREGLRGDKFLPPPISPPDLRLSPSAPDNIITGQIISAYDGINNVGQYQIVTLNRGEREGLVAGNILAADKRGGVVLDETADPVSPRVLLPNDPAGLLLVFKTYQRFSYALVMQADRPLAVGDIVRNP